MLLTDFGSAGVVWWLYCGVGVVSVVVAATVVEAEMIEVVALRLGSDIIRLLRFWLPWIVGRKNNPRQFGDWGRGAWGSLTAHERRCRADDAWPVNSRNLLRKRSEHELQIRNEVGNCCWRASAAPEEWACPDFVER